MTCLRLTQLHDINMTNSGKHVAVYKLDNYPIQNMAANKMQRSYSQVMSHLTPASPMMHSLVSLHHLRQTSVLHLLTANISFL